MLMIFLRWKCATTGDAELDGVPVCIPGQVENSNGNTTRSNFAEMLAFTFPIEITCAVKVCSKVLEQLRVYFYSHIMGFLRPSR